MERSVRACTRRYREANLHDKIVAKVYTSHIVYTCCTYYSSRNNKLITICIFQILEIIESQTKKSGYVNTCTTKNKCWQSCGMVGKLTINSFLLPLSGWRWNGHLKPHYCFMLTSAHDILIKKPLHEVWHSPTSIFLIFYETIMVLQLAHLALMEIKHVKMKVFVGVNLAHLIKHRK